MDEQVLVIRIEKMRDLHFTDGFTPISDGVLEQLCDGAIFISRVEAEVSSKYKQLIPYSILRMGDRIFRYQRTKAGGESRLFQLYSVGVGGHINPEDGDPSGGVGILYRARLREIQEEFACVLTGEPRLVGLINDDDNPVGRVHLGIVFEYQLASDQVTPNEPDNFAQYGLVQPSICHQDATQFETWSQIVIRSLMKQND